MELSKPSTMRLKLVVSIPTSSCISLSGAFVSVPFFTELMTLTRLRIRFVIRFTKNIMKRIDSSKVPAIMAKPVLRT
ncbi:hypothetical protein D3C73_1295410 [compost metagenome]